MAEITDIEDATLEQLGGGEPVPQEIENANGAEIENEAADKVDVPGEDTSKIEKNSVDSHSNKEGNVADPAFLDKGTADQVDSPEEENAQEVHKKRRGMNLGKFFKGPSTPPEASVDPASTEASNVAKSGTRARRGVFSFIGTRVSSKPVGEVTALFPAGNPFEGEEGKENTAVADSDMEANNVNVEQLGAMVKNVPKNRGQVPIANFRNRFSKRKVPTPPIAPIDPTSTVASNVAKSGTRARRGVFSFIGTRVSSKPVGEVTALFPTGNPFEGDEGQVKNQRKGARFSKLPNQEGQKGFSGPVEDKKGDFSVDSDDDYTGEMFLGDLKNGTNTLICDIEKVTLGEQYKKLDDKDRKDRIEFIKDKLKLNDFREGFSVILVGGIKALGQGDDLLSETTLKSFRDIIDNYKKLSDGEKNTVSGRAKAIEKNIAVSLVSMVDEIKENKPLGIDGAIKKYCDDDFELASLYDDVVQDVVDNGAEGVLDKEGLEFRTNYLASLKNQRLGSVFNEARPFSSKGKTPLGEGVKNTKNGEPVQETANNGARDTLEILHRTNLQLPGKRSLAKKLSKVYSMYGGLSLNTRHLDNTIRYDRKAYVELVKKNILKAATKGEPYEERIATLEDKFETLLDGSTLPDDLGTANRNALMELADANEKEPQKCNEYFKRFDVDPTTQQYLIKLGNARKVGAEKGDFSWYDNIRDTKHGDFVKVREESVGKYKGLEKEERRLKLLLNRELFLAESRMKKLVVESEKTENNDHNMMWKAVSDLMKLAVKNRVENMKLHLTELEEVRANKALAANIGASTPKGPLAFLKGLFSKRGPKSQKVNSVFDMADIGPVKGVVKNEDPNKELEKAAAQLKKASLTNGTTTDQTRPENLGKPKDGVKPKMNATDEGNVPDKPNGSAKMHKLLNAFLETRKPQGKVEPKSNHNDEGNAAKKKNDGEPETYATPDASVKANNNVALKDLLITMNKRIVPAHEKDVENKPSDQKSQKSRRISTGNSMPK